MGKRFVNGYAAQCVTRFSKMIVGWNSFDPSKLWAMQHFKIMTGCAAGF